MLIYHYGYVIQVESSEAKTDKAAVIAALGMEAEGDDGDAEAEGKKS